MNNNFLNCDQVFPFSFGPQNDDAISIKQNSSDEVILNFDMSVTNCPQGCGFAFKFYDGCPHNYLRLNLEQLEGPVDDLTLKLELKLSGNRIYDQHYISGREWLFIDNVRRDTAEICIVCFKTALTTGKKGVIRIYI